MSRTGIWSGSLGSNPLKQINLLLNIANVKYGSLPTPQPSAHPTPSPPPLFLPALINCEINIYRLEFTEVEGKVSQPLPCGAKRQRRLKLVYFRPIKKVEKASPQVVHLQEHFVTTCLHVYVPRNIKRTKIKNK